MLIEKCLSLYKNEISKRGTYTRIAAMHIHIHIYKHEMHFMSNAISVYSGHIRLRDVCL